MARPGLFVILAALATGLGGCGYTPQQLGITGPGTATTPLPSHASETEEDSIIPAPGLPAGFGERYAPAVVPTSGQNGQFYGYN